MKGWAGSYIAEPETAALTDGRWVRRGMVWFWVSDTPRPAESEPCISHNTERGWQWHRTHRIDWPLTPDDLCGCHAAHYAHVAFNAAMNRRAREAAAA